VRTDESLSTPSDIPVRGPESDPATALIRSLTPRLSEEDERELAHHILTDHTNAIQDRGEWEGRLGEWDDAYHNRTVDKTFPWVGACNFHVPITMLGVETYKPRLVDAILGQQPPILVVPTTAAGEDRRMTVETVLNWQVQSQLKLEATVTQSAHLFLQPGLAVAKTYWKVDRRRRKFVREFPPSTTMPAIFEAIFGTDQPRHLESTGEQTWRGEIVTSPQGGGPLEVLLTVKVLEDGIQVLVDRDDVTEHPQVDLVEPIDLFVPVKGGQEVMELPWVQQRLWMTQDDLRRKVLQGRFYKDSVAALLTSGTPKGDKPTLDSQRYREAQDAAEGVEGLEHQAAEHGVDLASQHGLGEARQLFGCVLTVAVEERHGVELLSQGVGVAHLLVAPVPLVVPVPEHGHAESARVVLVLHPDCEGAVGRGVVHHQDLAIVVRQQ